MTDLYEIKTIKTSVPWFRQWIRREMLPALGEKVSGLPLSKRWNRSLATRLIINKLFTFFHDLNEM